VQKFPLNYLKKAEEEPFFSGNSITRSEMFMPKTKIFLAIQSLYKIDSRPLN
jgi:hypothetical protein